MNVVDFVIIGIVVVIGLIGLRSGLLNQISGIGGLIIGILIAMQYNAEVAAMLVDYIEGDLPSRVAAFGGIVIATTIAAKLAVWMVRKIFRSLVTGWVDRVAGAVGGAALGLILVGTGVFLLTGADLDPTREALAASKLAPEISRATVLSSNQPWCSQIDGGVVGTDCTDINGLLDKYFGESITQKVTSFLGEDFGSLADVVQTTLSGSPDDLTGILDGDAAQRPPTLWRFLGSR
jgi:membrane protein required for colicin V production